VAEKRRKGGAGSLAFFTQTPPASTESPATPEAEIAPEPRQGVAGEVSDAEDETAVTWRKSTIPFRSDQYDELDRTLAQWRLEKGVRATMAEVIRLGLDTMLQQMREDADVVILRLYEQEQRELAGNENRKHSKSQGAKEYLLKHRLLDM
jgi:hypothetical protein